MKTVFYAFGPDGVLLDWDEYHSKLYTEHPNAEIVQGHEWGASVRASVGKHSARIGYYPTSPKMGTEYRNIWPWRAFIDGVCMNHFETMKQALGYMKIKGFNNFIDEL